MRAFNHAYTSDHEWVRRAMQVLTSLCHTLFDILTTFQICFRTHSVPTSELAGYITVNYKRVTDKRVVKPWISVTSIMVNPKWSGTPDDRHWVCSWLEHIPWYFFIFRYFRPFIYFILIMTEKTLRLLKFKTLTLSTFQLVLFLPDNIEATFHCAYAGFH